MTGSPSANRASTAPSGVVAHLVTGQRSPGAHSEPGEQQTPQHVPVDDDPGLRGAELTDLIQLRIQDQPRGGGVADDRLQQRVPALRQTASQRVVTHRAQHEPVALEPRSDRRVPLEYLDLDALTMQALRQTQTTQTGSATATRITNLPSVDP